MDTEITLRVNGEAHPLTVDTRTTLLDALREHLGLTGTKKGCDHGQCGACTVLSTAAASTPACTLAVAARRRRDHHDRRPRRRRRAAPAAAARSSSTTPSSAATARPARSARPSACSTRRERGWPSAVTDDRRRATAELTDDEIRERMSGNLCRCGAYANIVAAVRDAPTEGGRR